MTSPHLVVSKTLPSWILSLIPRALVLSTVTETVPIAPEEALPRFVYVSMNCVILSGLFNIILLVSARARKILAYLGSSLVGLRKNKYKTSTHRILDPSPNVLAIILVRSLLDFARLPCDQGVVAAAFGIMHMAIACVFLGRLTGKPSSRCVRARAASSLLSA